MSPRAEAARDAAKLALQQALQALDRATTDDDVRLVLEVVEGYGAAGLTGRLAPLNGIEEQLLVSSNRLSRLTRKESR
jgi:hypothetical protein